MYRLIVFILSLGPAFCLGQDPNEELIHWSKSKRLSWNDYKGEADQTVGAAASTATYLGIDYNFSPRGLTYKITCSFSKNKSWGIHKTVYILSHEQGHFDIAEIFARKLNKKMAAYKFNRNTYKEDLRRIYEDIIAEKEEMQSNYDRETDHSINKEKQAEWLQKIEAMLEEFQVYSMYS